MSQLSSPDIKLHALDYLRVIRVRWPIVLLVFLLVMITAMVVTYFAPRKYAASATMQVKVSDYTISVFGSSGGTPGGAGFATTQNEIIKRTEVLYPVIEALKLVDRWRGRGVSTKREAQYVLSGMLQVKAVPNTDLIDIQVTSANPAEAAEIANAVAEGYKNRRIAEARTWLEKALAALDGEIDVQRQEVGRLRNEAARIAKENNITDLNPDAVEEVGSTQNSAVTAVDSELNSERTRVAALKARFHQLNELSDETIMRTAKALGIDDSIILQGWPEYQTMVAEETQMLNSGLGSNHPKVAALRSKKQERFRQLTNQIAAYRKSFSSQLAMAESTLKSLEERSTSVQDAYRTTRITNFEYMQAKNNYIQAKKLLDASEMRLQTEKFQIKLPSSPITIWEFAEPNNSPVSPNVMLNMVVAAILGLVFGVGLAFMLEYLDTSVKTLEEVEQLLGVPVLAVITKNIKILLNQPEVCPDAEAYRILRTNVEFNRKNPDANTITVVSGGAGEGKSTTIANLAFTFAKGGYNTLIVDADLRRPTQHRIFNIPNEHGLNDYLRGNLSLDEAVVNTAVPNLSLLPSGRPAFDASGILNSQRLDELLTAVKSRFDVIFFDSPPILGVSDASILSSAVDYTLIVVQHRRFPKNMLGRVKQAVQNVGGNILGVVLNNVDVRHDSHYEYYTSYYHYYPKDEPRKEKPQPPVLPAPSSPQPGGRANSNEY